MTNDHGKRVYTKRSLAQRAAEAQDKATKLQAAANKQRERCLIELGGALVAVLRNQESKEAWVKALSIKDVRNKRRRAEAISWLCAELNMPEPTQPTSPAADNPEAPVKESKAPAGAKPPTMPQKS